jgi:predicted O-linked N-acetylglucosamine transferase (SPINDLY family)
LEREVLACVLNHFGSPYVHNIFGANLDRLPHQHQSATEAHLYAEKSAPRSMFHFAAGMRCARRHVREAIHRTLEARQAFERAVEASPRHFRSMIGLAYAIDSIDFNPAVELLYRKAINRATL